MLLASSIKVLNADDFLDAVKRAIKASKDWKYAGVHHFGPQRSVLAEYTGRKFDGEGLQLTVLAVDGMPSSVWVILRARRWPTAVCWNPEDRPEAIPRPILKEAFAAHRPKLSVVPAPVARRRSKTTSRSNAESAPRLAVANKTQAGRVKRQPTRASR